MTHEIETRLAKVKIGAWTLDTYEITTETEAEDVRRMIRDCAEHDEAGLAPLVFDTKADADEYWKNDA